MLVKGKIPTRDEEAIMKAMIYENIKRKKFKIERGEYKKLKHKIDIVITGEKIDIPAKLTTLQVLMQMLGQNPAVLQNKSIRKILFKTLDLSGFNPNEFDFEEEPQGVEGIQALRGGSMPRPAYAGTSPTTMPQKV